jgi:DNA-binding transcriptional MocR family regulator
MLTHRQHGGEQIEQRSTQVVLTPVAGSRARRGPGPSQQLQQENDVGRDTVLHAIEILRNEGLVFTVPRRGTYSPDVK